jgi:prepilin-type N-terminal cleavage/methylation domain-containing protein
MKNNKGMTIVEIIVSITLVSVVLVFLLNLLITVKGYKDKSQSASDLLINQALITKEAENDINNYGLTEISYCDDNILNGTSASKIIPSGASNIYCLKLIFNDDLLTDNIGYLLQYTYQYSSTTTKNVVGYKRGTNQVVRESSISMDPDVYKGSVSSSCSTNNYSNCSLKIVLPVIGNDDNNYDITLTYIYQSSNFTYNKFSNKYGFTAS